MPIDLGRSNYMIVKGIINKWRLNENKICDIFCRRELGKMIEENGDTPDFQQGEGRFGEILEFIYDN